MPTTNMPSNFNATPPAHSPPPPFDMSRWDRDLAELQMMLRDLDGDGIPDIEQQGGSMEDPMGMAPSGSMGADPFGGGVPQEPQTQAGPDIQALGEEARARISAGEPRDAVIQDLFLRVTRGRADAGEIAPDQQPDDFGGFADLPGMEAGIPPPDVMPSVGSQNRLLGGLPAVQGQVPPTPEWEGPSFDMPRAPPPEPSMPGVAVDMGGPFQQATRGMGGRMESFYGGAPDVIGSQPPGPVNAHAEFPAIRQSANEMMPPVEMPQPSPEAKEVGGESWRDWASQYSGTGLAPTVVDAGFQAYDALPDMSGVTDNPLTRHLGASADAMMRAPGDIMDAGPGALLKNMQHVAPAVGMPANAAGLAGQALQWMRNPEVTRAAATGNWGPIQQAATRRTQDIMTAPAHTLQKRNALGRFQKFDKETREIRDRAAKERSWRKENSDLLRRMNDRAN